MKTYRSFAEKNPHRTLNPLMRAAASGQLATVETLIEEGADINQRGPRESTALMFAAGGGHLEVVKCLVDHGAELGATEDGGWNAEQHAVDSGFDGITTYLRNASSMR